MDRIKQLDLATLSVREVNQFLHHELSSMAGLPQPKGLSKPLDKTRAKNARVKMEDSSDINQIEILNPDGLHSIAAGLDDNVTVDILGHAGYFTAGMNKQANITIHGNVGWSVAENIMSGTVRVKGHASECAGSSGHGGLLVIEGDASSRCGISMKGCDIVVGGSVGHFSAFMAQAGTLVVCGDAGPNIGDSLYEATIYIRGNIHSFGADAQEEEMSPADYEKVSQLLTAAQIDCDPKEFKRVASAKNLYHWNAEAHQEY